MMEPGAFDLSGVRSCVACGLCLPHCPTYDHLRLETASPRGRLALMRGMESGALAPSERVRELLGLCLGCRACETACPSGVPFGHTLEQARALLEARVPRPLAVRLVGRLVLGWAFAEPWRLSLLAGGLHMVHRLGMPALARGLARWGLAPARLGILAGLLPEPDGLSARALGEVIEPEGRPVGTLAFLPGCIADIYLTAANRATVRVLVARGYRVIIPPGPACCGALHVHQGLMEEARALARRHVEALAGREVDAIVTNSAGCGSALKGYGALLEDRGGAGPAHAFAARVKDACEFLGEVGPPSGLGRVESRVTYDDPCHLVHAQRIREAPRQVISRVPGIELVEAPHADTCCGAAGIYSLTHTRTSLEILDRKLDGLLSVRPRIVLTANPGCLLHLRAGLRARGEAVEVLHVMELVARSLDAGAAGHDRA